MNSESASVDFAALGGRVSIEASGPDAWPAVTAAQSLVEEIHTRLSRFEPESELCQLNADVRSCAPCSSIMMRFAAALVDAGRLTGGLVDGTLLDQVEAAGYTTSIDPNALDRPPSREFNGHSTAHNQLFADKSGGWDKVSVDPDKGEVFRPPGLRLDSGGLGKGLAADVVSEALAHLDYFVVDCSGDLRFWNCQHAPREVQVISPFPREGVIAKLELADTAIATSGITRRCWLDHRGDISHHLIDPRTGKPAFSGVTQVTAVAPTGVEAEVRAKAALLSGPDNAAGWLIHGGVFVTSGGSVENVQAVNMEAAVR